MKKEQSLHILQVVPFSPAGEGIVGQAGEVNPPIPGHKVHNHHCERQKNALGGSPPCTDRLASSAEQPSC